MKSDLLPKARVELTHLAASISNGFRNEELLKTISHIPDNPKGIYAVLSGQGFCRSDKALLMLSKCAEPYSFSLRVYNPAPLYRGKPHPAGFYPDVFKTFWSALEFLIFQKPKILPQVIAYLILPKNTPLDWMDAYWNYEPKWFKRED